MLKKSHFDGAIRIIDWSLIAIDSTNAARSQTANRIPVFQGLKKHSRYDNVDYVDVVAEGSISNRPIGSYVFKLGAVSGLTEGRIASQKSDVDMDDSEEFTTEYCIVNVDNSSFAKPGDSGTWVVDGKGAAVGYMIGGQNKELPMRTYVSDMRMVFDDIQAQTGHRPQIVTATDTYS